MTDREYLLHYLTFGAVGVVLVLLALHVFDHHWLPLWTGVIAAGWACVRLDQRFGSGRLDDR